jgi:CheY-like chemotaxis protein
MSTQNKHLLIVEDEPDGQEVVSRMLEYVGVTSDTVAMAEDALSYLDQNTYHGIVIDLMLPQMDGIELIKQIRQHPSISNLPCIAITAFHTSAVKQEALASGFDTYMSKPLDDTAFIRAIDNMLSG